MTHTCSTSTRWQTRAESFNKKPE